MVMDMDMDMDNEAMMSSTLAEDSTVPITQLDNVFSMDEYRRGFEAEHAAAKAARSVSAGLKKAPGKANVIIPTPGSGPVAISARSSMHTIALHEKYQALGIPQPTFKFEGSSDRGWSGELSFPGLDVEELQGIKDETIYTGKQQAKEALSERALEILLRLEKEGRVKKASASARARTSKHAAALNDKHQKLGIPQPFFAYTGSTDVGWIAQVSFPGLWVHEVPSMQNDHSYPSKSEAKEALSQHALEALDKAEIEGKFERFGKAKGPAQQELTEERKPGPNYLGQLLEFQRATKGPQPTYTEYAVGATRFACQVSIGAALFGSLDENFSSKKVARQEAARHAVDAFKAQGIWPESATDVGGIKKKAVIMASTPEVISSTAARTPQSNQLPISPFLSPSATQSSASQVDRLAHTLSLPTPEWRSTPSPLDRDFHTVACYFGSSGPHMGPHGEVRNVFGKKKAKEECARLTLEYLTALHKSRIEWGRRMVEGITGGGDVDMGEDGEGEGEFEDAVEVL